MGPASATAPSETNLATGRWVPLSIGRDRKGVLRAGLVHLDLPLSSSPDRAWVAAFYQASSDQAATQVHIVGAPQIRRDRITWPVPEVQLMVAWNHITTCIFHANAAYRTVLSQQAKEKQV